MTTKTKKAMTPKMTEAIYDQWIEDLRNFKGYTIKVTGTDPHLLGWTQDQDGTKTWFYDVFGVLMDRLATTWIMDRQSSVHENTWYYIPMVKIGRGMRRLDLADLGFQPGQCYKLVIQAFDGRLDFGEFADLLESKDPHRIFQF